MGVSETWLKDSGYSFDIMGYDFIHKPRPNRIGGGVGNYVNNDLEFKPRPDLTFPDISSSSTESLFLEIRRPLSNNTSSNHRLKKCVRVLVGWNSNF